MRELRGAAVAAALDERTLAIAQNLSARGVTPTLALVRVGEQAASLSYQTGVEKRCGKVGLTLRVEALPETAAQTQLMAVLGRLAADPGVHGILLLHPLPGHMDETAARDAIPGAKDVDGVTRDSLARVFSGEGEGFAPCTAQAVREILDFYGIDCAGKRAVVLGRSLTVGRPAAMLLMERGATVTICHSGTPDAPALARQADILVAAVGRPGTVDAAYLAPGQTVGDVGIHRGGDGKLCGDVDAGAAADTVSALTPVPGGVGAVTTSVLLHHTVQAAEQA